MEPKPGWQGTPSGSEPATTTRPWVPRLMSRAGRLPRTLWQVTRLMATTLMVRKPWNTRHWAQGLRSPNSCRHRWLHAQEFPDRRTEAQGLARASRPSVLVQARPQPRPCAGSCASPTLLSEGRRGVRGRRKRWTPRWTWPRRVPQRVRQPAGEHPCGLPVLPTPLPRQQAAPETYPEVTRFAGTRCGASRCSVTRRLRGCSWMLRGKALPEWPSWQVPALKPAPLELLRLRAPGRSAPEDPAPRQQEVQWQGAHLPGSQWGSPR